jgi:ketosteroid isomerase-like protein
MSQENAELARRSIDMFNRRDLDGFLALQAENVTADPLLAAVEGGYHGPDGVRQWWKNLLETIPDFTGEVLGARDYGRHMVVLRVHTRGHGAESGAPFDELIWLPIRIQQGKAVWWGVFMTEQEALGAAGLRE